MKLSVIEATANALPEVTQEPHFQYDSFRVHGKIFVTVPPEKTHIHVFVPEAVREPALAMHPEFLAPLLWGGKVVGLRVTLAHAQADAVCALVQQAWHSKNAKPVRKPAPFKPSHRLTGTLP